MLDAHDRGNSRCGNVSIEIRRRGADSSMYMFSVDGKPVAQANIPDCSVGRLENLSEEFSRWVDDVVEVDDSNKVDMNGERRIGDLRLGLKDVCFKAVVAKKSSVRAVTSRDGAALLVCSVTLSDGTGEIPLTVWNNQIGTVSEGDRVQVHDARVRSYRGEIQLSLSRKAGGLIVLESGMKAPTIGV
jgi:hypothetical protein